MGTKKISVHHTKSGPRYGTDHQWCIGENENDGRSDPRDFKIIYWGHDFKAIRDVFVRYAGRPLSRQEETSLQREPGDGGICVTADCVLAKPPGRKK